MWLAIIAARRVQAMVYGMWYMLDAASSAVDTMSKMWRNAKSAQIA